MQRKSEARILQFLREHGESSIAELSRLTDLGKATASRAIQSLHARGLIEYTGHEHRTRSSGRPGRALRLRPDTGLYLGIEVGFGDITLVLADAAKQIIACSRHQFSSAPTRLPTFSYVTSVADQLLDQVGGDPARVRGVGIAVAAPVDPKTGKIKRISQDLDWAVAEPMRAFSTHFRAPVLINNDVNCSALAELFSGRLTTDQTGVLLRMGRGVGGAIIHRGELLHGYSARAGDYGHIPYDPRGPECRCGGKGCYERYLSISAIEKDLGDTIDRLRERADSGDQKVQEDIRKRGHVLGSLAAVVSRTVDPDVLIVGGEVVRLGESFICAANERLQALNRQAAPIQHASSRAILQHGLFEDEPALGAIWALIRNEQMLEKARMK